MKQECVKATAMHEVCKTKYGCGVDKAKQLLACVMPLPFLSPILFEAERVTLHSLNNYL